nr:type I-B CRISPR-associated protein Cas7/Cst2/DevR [uncultured Arsenicibacter sp.]
MNLKTQGFVLLDVDVVALNNAGKSSSSNFENAVATKKITKNGRTHTYVSGQAWRYWWREALQRNIGWSLSPITRENKIAFTEANPFLYPDDDVFGYMKAVKEEVVDDKGKTKKVDATVTRVSPLKNSAIVSVGSARTVENWSSMARQDGDSVPYSKEEYSAIMKGMFSLDLAQLGTFASYNKTGFKNITQKLRNEALNQGATEINDPYVKDGKGNPQKLVQLPGEVRLQRAKDTIQALKTISGGAMQTNNMGDVTPKFIVLATTSSGNHPFSHIVMSEGMNNDKVVLNLEGLKEVLKEYKEQFIGTVFIGKRNGFLNDYNDELNQLLTLGDSYPVVRIGAVNEMIDAYCAQLENQIS